MKNNVEQKAIKIISPLNASQKLLVSEVLKLVKLILLVPPLMLPVKDHAQRCAESRLICDHL